MADEVEEKAARGAGYTPVHMEGYQVATWILLDYSDVVVHIFYGGNAQILRYRAVLDRREEN